MKLSPTLFTILFSLILTSSYSQTQFILQGKVEYEKKVNMHALMGEGFWASEMKDKLPQFRSTFFDLVFDTTRSVYKAGREVEDKYKMFWGNTSSDDITFNDYSKGQTAQQKDVFEKTYLLQDSLLNIEWRITPETRTIAGFECRKAVGKFMDSLYVTAFYSEQIVAPGGPESFSGLPGLILGLGFPRIHTTWFATKLELKQIQPKELAAPAKGKKATRTEILNTVRSAVKDWGSESQSTWIQAII
jgi:GLPGLI family protein